MIGEGTIPRKVKAALADAEKAGVTVTYDDTGTATSRPLCVLSIAPSFPPPHLVRSNHKTPNQPWYARYRKDKR